MGATGTRPERDTVAGMARSYTTAWPCRRANVHGSPLPRG
jgi:hypothetical protein